MEEENLTPRKLSLKELIPYVHEYRWANHHVKADALQMGFYSLFAAMTLSSPLSDVSYIFIPVFPVLSYLLAKDYRHARKAKKRLEELVGKENLKRVAKDVCEYCKVAYHPLELP